MIINFVGNFALGYVGEVSDEIHLARELEDLGHTVNKVPRDQWKAFVDGEKPNTDWVLPTDADFNLIAKWDKFDDPKYIEYLEWKAKAPVFYWVWDYMLDPIFPEWHLRMAKAADLYLSGELGLASKYRQEGINFYYFQFDVCDGNLPTFRNEPKKFDVVFTGSYLGQGDRIEYLTKINAALPGKLQIFSWNYLEWKQRGFEAYPAVYGAEYNQLLAKTKIVIGLSVEPNCYGYWSNRVGKVLRARAQLLQQWAPGMETLLPSCIEYFSSPEEAIQKIKELLNNSYQCEDSHWELTSRRKTIALVTLMERFLKGDPKKWILP